jgi:large subunit ribosomal protein L10
MNREQKAAVVEEVATQIQESEAVFAVDYRGISVPQAAELRVKLNDAGARFRVVKNTLTELAADKAGADPLKEMLDGPTAFTFVTGEGGDVALAAKALAQFRRETELLEFKGGVMNGEPLTPEQITEIARLPAKDVLYGQVVGMIASPITGLVRGLNALIAGLAIQLKQIADEGMVPVGGEATAAEEPAAAPEEPATEEEAATEEEPAAETEGGAEPEVASEGEAAPSSEEPAAEAQSGDGSAAEGEPAAEAEAESGDAPAAEASEASEPDPAEADQAAQADQAEDEAAQSAEGEETESSSEESAPAGDEAAGEETNESETPSEGDEKE